MRTYVPCNSLIPVSNANDSAPPFIYSITYILSGEDSFLFVGISSNDAIFTFSLVRHDMVKWAFKLHYVSENAHPGISCCAPLQLQNNASQASGHFVTAGRDGAIRFWAADSITPSMRSVHQDGSKPISAIATHAANQQALIACGTETENEGPGDVEIHVWSVSTVAGSEAQNLFRLYKDSHSGDITSLQFYGEGQRAVLVSGSTDGLISFFNLEEQEEDDAVVTVINSKSAVARFSLVPTKPKSEGTLPEKVCVISHDEKVSLHSPEEQSAGEEQTIDIRESMRSDYAIAIKDCKDGTSILAVGAYKPETVGASSSPYVDNYRPARGQSFTGDCECIARLEGAHGDEIVRDIWIDDSRDVPQVILTCGEDGVIRAWSQPAEQTNLKPKLKRDREDNPELDGQGAERQKIRSR